MFERFRSRSGHADAPRHVHASDTQANHELQDWQTERAQVVALLDAARSAPITPDGLMIHRGEGCCGILEHCSLIEERREAGHYAGGSTGVSIPIGSLAGRSVRYRVGANRGHYVQGALSPTAIASGTLYFTNQRIVFLGPTQTRECAFTKLIGITHDDEQGTLTISVSNRQHPTVIHFGPSVADWVQFRTDLALARYRGDDDQLIARLSERLEALDARQPAAPSSAPTDAGGTAPKST